MRMNTYLSRGLFCFVFICVCLIFLCIQDKTPLRFDDFDFITTYQKDENGVWRASGALITSSSEILDACCAHRYMKNGRLSDIFAILSLNLLGKYGFVVFNTIVAAIFALLYMRICRLKYNALFFLFFLLVAFMLIPSALETIFWRPGACNYLWGAVVFGLFIRAYEKLKNGALTRNLFFVCCLLAMLCCAYHEALGAAVIGMLIVDYYFENGFKYTPKVWVVISAVIGFIVVISSPAIWRRVATEIGGEKSVVSSLYALMYHSIVPIFCFVCCTCKKGVKKLKNPVFLFTLFSFMLLCVIGNANSRAGFYFSLGTLILTLRSFSFNSLKWKGAVAACSMVVLAFWSCSFYKQNKLTGEVLDYAIKKSQQKGNNSNEIVVYDVTEKPERMRNRVFKNGIYERGVTEQIEKSFLCWQCKPFRVVTNALVTDKGIYDVFRGASDNSYQVAHVDGLGIVRYPIGVEPTEGKKYLHILNGENKLVAVARTFIGTSGLGMLQYKIIKNLRVVDYSFDYDGRYFYLVLSSDLGENLSIQLPAGRDGKVKTISLKSTVKVD